MTDPVTKASLNFEIKSISQWKPDATVELPAYEYVALCKIALKSFILQEMIKTFSEQKLTRELFDDAEYEAADFEGAYDTMIINARSVIATSEKEIAS